MISDCDNFYICMYLHVLHILSQFDLKDLEYSDSHLSLLCVLICVVYFLFFWFRICVCWYLPFILLSVCFMFLYLYCYFLFFFCALNVCKVLTTTLMTVCIMFFISFVYLLILCLRICVLVILMWAQFGVLF